MDKILSTIIDEQSKKVRTNTKYIETEKKIIDIEKEMRQKYPEINELIDQISCEYGNLENIVSAYYFAKGMQFQKHVLEIL